jgi:prepilin-type N-terminal cleavage/methylation domain-containing protein
MTRPALCACSSTKAFLQATEGPPGTAALFSGGDVIMEKYIARHCERSEAIQWSQSARTYGLLRRYAPRNDVNKNLSGFTLIELSIVLVIIGLIIGGVLVGQDMISAAQLRQSISQIGQYNSAVNTFRAKYNAIPGDITGTATGQAAAFGMFTETTLGGQAGHGDGNGLIEADLDGNAGGSGLAYIAVGETLSFWRHLTDTNLVGGAFGISGPSMLNAANGQATGPGTVTNIMQSLPPTKIGRGTTYIVYSENGLNYYQIIDALSIVASTGAYGFGTNALTPTESFIIDSKMDDGAPNTGTVRARGLGAVNIAASFPGVSPYVSTPSICLMGSATVTTATDTGATYNRVADTGGNDPSCSLRFQFN